MITKKFAKSYDDALTQAYLFHSGLVRDLLLFTAYSPMFIADYASDFLDLIEEAGSLPTNEEDLNNQVILSMEVEDKMEESRALYRKLISYVKLKWGESDSVLRAFGNNLYEKARQSPQKMINLLELANRAADSVKYKADLIAVGFLQVDITALLTMSEELNVVYNNQQEFMQLSSDRAEERIEAFNKFWDIMVQINNASKQVFKDSPALIEYYLLYPESSSPGSLTAPANLQYDQLTGRISWNSVENATSYKVEISFEGAAFEEVYAGHDLETYYIPPSTPSNFIIQVMARNSGGLGPVSPLTVFYDPPLQAPGYISISITNPTLHTIGINWGDSVGATAYRLYTSSVALGAPQGEFSVVGEYAGTSYSGTVIAATRNYFYVVAVKGSETSAPSDVSY
ncbi:MAG: hypothetical protein WC055_16290, partial [Melioribacteraceae bacterium]